MLEPEVSIELFRTILSDAHHADSSPGYRMIIEPLYRTVVITTRQPYGKVQTLLKLYNGTEQSGKCGRPPPISSRQRWSWQCLSLISIVLHLRIEQINTYQRQSFEQSLELRRPCRMLVGDSSCYYQ
jgi:hypothetical protein